MPLNPPLSESLKPVRCENVIISPYADRVEIFHPVSGKVSSLNPSAAFVWQQCDGAASLKEIASVVSDVNSVKETDSIYKETSDAIKQLFLNDLVTFQPGRASSILRIAFIGFEDGFDARDNIVTRALLRRFNLVLVEDSTSANAIVWNASDDIPELHQDQLLVAVGSAGIVEVADLTLSLDCVGNENLCIGLPDDYLSNPDAKLSDEALGKFMRFFSLDEPVNQDARSTPEKKNCKLTIGMATYDDYDGVYFSVQAIRLYHPEVTDETEILVIDNHPNGPCSEALKNLEHWIPNYRYVPNGEIRGTAVRDFVFHEATTEYVMCIDSHVFIEHGAIRKLIDYMDSHKNTPDLLQGPLVYDDLVNVATHFEPVWRDGMYGVWATDERGVNPDGEPFEIPMQGLGLAACRKDAWLGYNRRFSGFGGEEGYIHQKFRNAGAKTLCLPFLRWIHRFARPMGTHYENVWEDRIRNYMIGFDEVGIDPADMIKHFTGRVNEDVIDKATGYVEKERNNPFDEFEAIYCINLDSETDRWAQMRKRFYELGILHRVKRFSAVETPNNHHVGCALSHRTIIKQAKQRGYANVLVFEDDALFHVDMLKMIKPSVTELRNIPWKLFYIGGHRWGKKFDQAPGLKHLEIPEGLTCTHAVAYSDLAYDEILKDIPEGIDGVRKWLQTNHGIDQYLRDIDSKYVVTRNLSSQPPLLPAEDADIRDLFV